MATIEDNIKRQLGELMFANVAIQTQVETLTGQVNTLTETLAKAQEELLRLKEDAAVDDAIDPPADPPAKPKDRRQRRSDAPS